MATPRPSRRRPARRAPAATGTFHPKGPAHQEPKTVLPARGSPAAEGTRVGRFPKDAVIWLVILGALAYLTGWYVAYTGAALFPGFFLASDLGFITTMALLLRTVARITRARILVPSLAASSAAVPKAAGWSLAAFWFFMMFTMVPQLAIGLGGGILAYQLYATRSKLHRDGYAHATRFGPAFRPTAIVLTVYVAWFVVRRLAGSVPGFDLVTIAAAVFITVVVLRTADREANRLARTPQRVPAAKGETAVRRDLERRVVAGVIVGYLFFRFFISSAIPYGPIVEWFLVCVGAVFIAIVMADRIGVVPTKRSLPHPDVRTHVQRILSLPDRRLEETDAHLKSFIERGQDAEWVRTRFAALFEEAGIPQAEQDEHLAPFVAEGRRHRHAPVEAMGLEARERLIARLIHVLQAKRGNGKGATGTLKTAGSVRNDTQPRPVLTPAP